MDSKFLKSPLISVVVPFWNVEKYAENCIESLISQTYKNLEIILVDDCSTDSTLSILKKFELLDSRIRVIERSSNGGRSECRNSGVLAATGELLTFVDGDDKLVPNALEEVAKKYDPSVDVYWYGINIVYESNFDLKKSDDKYYRIRHSGVKEINREDLLDYDCSVCNKVFRRDLLKEDLLFKGAHYEDAIFFMKFFAFKRKIYFIDKKLYVYYRHPSSIMANTFGRQEGLAIEHIFLLDEVYDFWLKNNFLQESRIAFQRIVTTYFWLAFNYSPPYERARVVAEMVSRLRAWNIGSESNPVLEYIRSGNFVINFGPQSEKSSPNQIVSIPPLKGWQKLFAIRNENGHNTVRIFTKRVGSRKVRNIRKLEDK